MEMKELITKINELAQKQKTTGLTSDEISERAILRQLYLDNIKAQVKSHLDCVTIVDGNSSLEE